MSRPDPYSLLVRHTNGQQPPVAPDPNVDPLPVIAHPLSRAAPRRRHLLRAEQRRRRHLR